MRPPISYQQLDEALGRSSQLADENRRLREALERSSMQRPEGDPWNPSYIPVDPNGLLISGSGMAEGMTTLASAATGSILEATLTQQVQAAGLMDWTQVELYSIPRKLRIGLSWTTTRFNQMCRARGMNQERVSEYKTISIEMVDLAVMMMAYHAAPQDQLETLVRIRMEYERLPEYDPNSPYPYPTLEIDVENLIPFPGLPETVCLNPTYLTQSSGSLMANTVMDDEEVSTTIDGWTFTEAIP